MLATCMMMAVAVGAESLGDAADLRWNPRTDGVYHYDLSSTVDRVEPWELHRARTPLRVRTLTVDADLECAANQPNADRVDWTCDVSAARVTSAEVGPGSQGTLDRLAHAVLQSTVAATVRRDGRLQRVDVQLGTADPDEAAVRWLLERGLAGLDLQLPEPLQVDPWDQRASSFAATPSATGPLALTRLEHEVLGSTGAVTTIATRGELAHLVVDSALRPTRVGDARVDGVSTFDRSLGVLVERSWTVTNLGGNPYAQRASLKLDAVTFPDGPDATTQSLWSAP